MTDYELLYEFKIGQFTLKEASTPTVLGWVAGKLNNLQKNSPTMNELSALIQRPPMGMMSDGMKLEVMRKLEALDIKLC